MEAIAIINMHYMYGDDSDWRGARLIWGADSPPGHGFSKIGVYSPFKTANRRSLTSSSDWHPPHTPPPTHPRTQPPTPRPATHPRPTPEGSGATTNNNNNKQQQTTTTKCCQRTPGWQPPSPPPTHAHAGPASPFRRASPPHSDVGILALPCAGMRKNAGTRTRRVSGSSCTGAWPAWWRRPGHSETSTGRLLGRPLQREVHAARATAGRARLSAHGRARGLVRMYGSGHAPDLENVGIWAFPCAGARKTYGSGYLLKNPSNVKMLRLKELQ